MAYLGLCIRPAQFNFHWNKICQKNIQWGCCGRIMSHFYKTTAKMKNNHNTKTHAKSELLLVTAPCYCFNVFAADVGVDVGCLNLKCSVHKVVRLWCLPPLVLPYMPMPSFLLCFLDCSSASKMIRQRKAIERYGMICIWDTLVRPFVIMAPPCTQ